MVGSIRFLYYQFLIFGKPLVFSGTFVKSDLHHMEVEKGLLYFIKYWNSLEKFVITGLMWNNYDTTLEISHERKEIYCKIARELSRNFNAEEAILSDLKSVFGEYKITLVFTWDDGEDY